MLKKIRKYIRGVYYFWRVDTPNPQMHDRGNVSDVNHAAKSRTNQENIALATMNMQHTALEKNLLFMQLTVVFAFISLVSALVIGTYALNTKPNVKVEIHKQKTIQTTY